MTTRSNHIIRRLTALMTALGLLSLAACTSSSAGSGASASSTSTTRESEEVALFTPSDGITITQHTPLNKWAQLNESITDSLRSHGMQSSRIHTKTSNSLESQSRSIQDYVVDKAASSTHSASNDSPSQSGGIASSTRETLIVAPVAVSDDASRQYGDYASHPVSWKSAARASDVDAQSQAAVREAGERLVTALQLARDNGMHVIILANPVQGFTPDLFVQMSTAEQIGEVQAKKLVSKLALDKVSATSPKSIEMLLPYDSTQAGEAQGSASFAKQAFAGAWSVLRPYFKAGKAVSPSGTLTADTTDSDWMSVAFTATKTEQITSVVSKRLGMTGKSDPRTTIDGVLAMNDFVASGVVEELGNLGYTGTAADVNPSISIMGIMDNIAGKRDLAKKAVPEPLRKEDGSETSRNGSSSSATGTTKTDWPIVTGYGAYIDSIPDIVNGQQWMTALENRVKIGDDVARACILLDGGKTLHSLKSVSSVSINGVKTPTSREPLLSISASNLKRTLIDAGYISLADAGL